jgi:ATP-binding cassette subfamily B protein RaxB
LSDADLLTVIALGFGGLALAAVAEAAQVAEDISRFPMRYLSLVGDMGSTLSGGERQRVLLARALYRQPKILFLDEGTANLDEPTEERLADLIERLPITRIVVAHRPALVRRASKIFFVENGQLKLLSQPAPLSQPAERITDNVTPLLTVDA